MVKLDKRHLEALIQAGIMSPFGHGIEEEGIYFGDQIRTAHEAIEEAQSYSSGNKTKYHRFA